MFGDAIIKSGNSDISRNLVIRSNGGGGQSKVWFRVSVPYGWIQDKSSGAEDNVFSGPQTTHSLIKSNKTGSWEHWSSVALLL